MVALEMESPKTWLDVHPWRGRAAFFALGLAASLFIRSGLVNSDFAAQVWHDANRDKAAAIHQVQDKFKPAAKKVEPAQTEPSNCVPHPAPSDTPPP